MNRLLVPDQQEWVVGVVIPSVFAAIEADNDFIAPITFTSSELPDGISFNSSTGVFSGTPVVAQLSKTITVTATDFIGETETRGFEVIINLYPADSAQENEGSSNFQPSTASSYMNIGPVPGTGLNMENPSTTAAGAMLYLYPP